MLRAREWGSNYHLTFHCTKGWIQWIFRGQLNQQSKARMCPAKNRDRCIIWIWSAEITEPDRPFLCYNHEMCKYEGDENVILADMCRQYCLLINFVNSLLQMWPGRQELQVLLTCSRCLHPSDGGPSSQWRSYSSPKVIFWYCLPHCAKLQWTVECCVIFHFIWSRLMIAALTFTQELNVWRRRLICYPAFRVTRWWASFPLISRWNLPKTLRS